MNKQAILFNLIDSIGQHLGDMKETIEEVTSAENIDKGIKERLLFKLFYLKLAVNNIEYYL